MLISIVVPVYNGEKFLPKCIESILSQTYGDIEVILVDDGSTDNSPQICDYYAEQDCRIRVVHKQNEGSVLARHTGAKLASGDYLTFVDGDDFILSSRIQGFVEGIQKYGNVDIVCANLSYYPNSQRTISNTVEIGLYKGECLTQIRDIFLSNPPFFNFGITPNLVSKCVKKDFYCAYDWVPPSITLGDDLAVIFNLVLHAKTICVIENTDYMYRYNELSISHKYDAFLADKIGILIEYLKSYSGTDSILKKQIVDYQCLLLKNVVLNAFLYSNEKYRVGRKKLSNDMMRLDYKNVIGKVKYSSMKDKMIYWLLKNNQFFLLYVLVKLRG